MDVYRINKEPYHTDPLSTIGSYRHGGRWNPKGMGILYTSRTPELALLETLVHLPPVTLPEVPQLWMSTLRLPAGTLAETQTLLLEWLTEPFCLAVAVPSVIVEESYNLLLHPDHPAFAQVILVTQRPIPLDNRLRGQAPDQFRT
jgi:RES domain-containing protein